MTAMTSLSKGHVLTVDIQTALSEQECAESDEPPSAEQLTSWARVAYDAVGNEPNEVTIRLCDEVEITNLNREFRGKDKPTNVLSFPVELDDDIPAELYEEIGAGLLGDIVICHCVIAQEAEQQQKTLNDHYAHMVTHGILHLCGYDHQDDVSAEEMESLETLVLAKNNIANPYQ